MIIYKKFAPKKYKCLVCGHHPLLICPFVYDVIDIKTGKKVEQVEPVLVCTDVRGIKGCGTIFDPDQFGIRKKELIAKVICE